MKIDITTLHEGSNPVAFEIPADALRAIVRDMDDLYDASGAAAVSFDVQKVDALMLLRGRVEAPIAFECARCLARRERALTVPVLWSLVPKAELSAQLSADEEFELTSDDLDTSFYEGDEIDLGDLAREAILLELNPAPRCADDENCTPHPTLQLATDTPAGDPRWAPLAAALAARRSTH